MTIRNGLLSGVLLVAAATASAALPHPSVLNDEITLSPCRSAPVQALRVIEVGEATLWRDACVRGADSLTPPLLLEFAYRRNVPGYAFSRASMAMIERNVGADQFAALKARLETFNSHYRDIGNGDRYQLRYLEDGTLDLLLNNELLISERGHDFARAYLQIWFGPQPYSDRLKQRLLAAD
jgi:hypothetical protein